MMKKIYKYRAYSDFVNSDFVNKKQIDNAGWNYNVEKLEHRSKASILH
jgi:hypothetical protein